MINTPFFAAALLLALAGLLKVPALIRARRCGQWRLPAAVCALLLVGSLVLVLAAPDNIVRFNRWTGITNFSAPLVYGVLSAYSAVGVVLILVWRGAPPGGSRLTPRRCLLAYAGIIVAIVTLFVLGETPDERVRDFDTHYANTPYIREMIVLYLLAHGFAAGAMVVLCRRWALAVDGLLRIGLRLLVAGYGLNVGYDIAKSAAVGARWAGWNWDALSTVAAPAMALFATVLVVTGFILPFVGQRLRASAAAYRRWRRLAPLARLVVARSAGAKVSPPFSGWAPEMRMTQREVAIHDAMLELRPFMDPGVREAVRERAAVPGPRAELESVAAMVAVAAESGSFYREALAKALADATTRDAPAPEKEAEAAARRAVLESGRYLSTAGSQPHPHTDLPDLAELSAALHRSDIAGITRDARTAPRV
ncbi:MAB_1171c family putative transporter [Streptomyces sp. CAU 1734]|uniref:MAB_1171c family putative transporter n=1 Tax=Streptomyces sp. CAU 1734 TaxID=3140360 RepID=UPI00325FE0BC